MARPFNAMKLSIASAILAIAAECVFAKGEIPPSEGPNRKGRPGVYSTQYNAPGRTAANKQEL